MSLRGQPPISINLPVPPSVNSLTFNRRGGRTKTKRYTDWITEAGWEIHKQKPPKIRGPVQVDIEVENGATRADIDNLIKPLLDVCVSHKLIENDSPKFVKGVSIALRDGIHGCQIFISPEIR